MNPTRACEKTYTWVGPPGSACTCRDRWGPPTCLQKYMNFSYKFDLCWSVTKKYLCFMNILILGSGGRESAFAWKISQSPHCYQLFIAPGNGGTGLPRPESYFDGQATCFIGRSGTVGLTWWRSTAQDVDSEGTERQDRQAYQREFRS